jgi:hypothetical protein
MSNAITDQQKIQQLTEAYEAFGADTSKWPDNRDTYLSQFAEHPDVSVTRYTGAPGSSNTSRY